MRLCSVCLVILLTSFGLRSQTLPRLQPIEVNQGLTFWAISAVDDHVAWISANKGTVGITTNGGGHWNFRQVKGQETREFRSVYAFDEKTAIVANVASPAQILRTIDGGKTWSIVFQHESPDAFIDGIDFWNEREGMIYGDPVDGKMFIMKTEDGGITWKPVTQPVLAQGEASFASSGTGIRCLDNETVVIATGGIVSRLLTSKDKGKNWILSEPMLRQESKSGGIFSTSFVKNLGVVVGGDFADSLANDLARFTVDGGRSWQTPRTSPKGTRWCVEFVSDVKVVAVGPSGGDISIDGGKSWTSLFEDADYHVVRKSRNGNLVLVAGSKGKLARLNLE